MENPSTNSSSNLGIYCHDSSQVQKLSTSSGVSFLLLCIQKHPFKNLFKSSGIQSASRFQFCLSSERIVLKKVIVESFRQTYSPPNFSKRQITVKPQLHKQIFTCNDNSISRNCCVAVVHQNFGVQHVLRWQCSNF